MNAPAELPRSAYLGGPIKDMPELNFPEFKRIAILLRKAGIKVLSPIEMDSPLDLKLRAEATTPEKQVELWRHMMRRDVNRLISGEVESMVAMHGWLEKSKGTKLEVINSCKLAGIPVFEFRDVDREAGTWDLVEMRISVTVKAEYIAFGPGIERSATF